MRVPGVAWVFAEALSLACVDYLEGSPLQEATVAPLHAAVCADVLDSLGDSCCWALCAAGLSWWGPPLDAGVFGDERDEGPC